MKTTNVNWPIRLGRGFWYLFSFGIAFAFVDIVVAENASVATFVFPDRTINYVVPKAKLCAASNEWNGSTKLPFNLSERTKIANDYAVRTTNSAKKLYLNYVRVQSLPVKCRAPSDETIGVRWYLLFSFSALTERGLGPDESRVVMLLDGTIASEEITPP
jgi:hypothetical protein